MCAVQADGRAGRSSRRGDRQDLSGAADHLIGPADLGFVGLEGRLVPFRPQVQRPQPRDGQDQAEAEELTQDVRTRALDRIGQLRDPQAALAWLYRIATTVALDRLRQRRPATVALDEVALSGEAAEAAADGER